METKPATKRILRALSFFRKHGIEIALLPVDPGAEWKWIAKLSATIGGKERRSVVYLSGVETDQEIAKMFRIAKKAWQTWMDSEAGKCT